MVGSAWATALCESVRTQGRPIAGGWPGTMVEARTKIAGHLAHSLAARRMSPARPEELAIAASATYARAKKDWLAAERVSQYLLRSANGGALTD